jgi:hypothetical protein
MVVMHPVDTRAASDVGALGAYRYDDIAGAGRSARERLRDQ